MCALMHFWPTMFDAFKAAIKTQKSIEASNSVAVVISTSVGFAHTELLALSPANYHPYLKVSRRMQPSKCPQVDIFNEPFDRNFFQK